MTISYVDGRTSFPQWTRGPTWRGGALFASTARIYPPSHRRATHPPWSPFTMSQRIPRVWPSGLTGFPFHGKLDGETSRSDFDAWAGRVLGGRHSALNPRVRAPRSFRESDPGGAAACRAWTSSAPSAAWMSHRLAPTRGVARNGRGRFTRNMTVKQHRRSFLSDTRLHRGGERGWNRQRIHSSIRAS